MASIPVFTTRGVTIPEAWENSVLKLRALGADISTQYDQPGDPPSKDCSMMMVIEDPLREPMLHREIPCGPDALSEYVKEVCDGIKDHLIRDPNDPNDHRWEYTYHQRLFGYDFPVEQDGEIGKKALDQIEGVCQRLAECPYTRRAQAITWKVWEDNSCYDPPCLQSIWCRILPSTELHLDMNIRFRSRDAYKAAFMNTFALVMLQKRMAERISELRGETVHVGRFVDFSDSYHIYGKNLQEFDNRFMQAVEKREFQYRTFNSCVLD